MDYNIDKKIIKSSTHIDTTNIMREIYIYESQINDSNGMRVIMVSTMNNDRVAVVPVANGMVPLLMNSSSRVEIDAMNRLYINGMVQDVTAIQMTRE